MFNPRKRVRGQEEDELLESGYDHKVKGSLSLYPNGLQD